MVAEAVGIGIVTGFIFTEFVGLSPGGLIVPGYLAFFLDQPLRVGLTLLAAFLSYLIVLFLSNFIIIYSRRRFMTAVLVGYLVGWVMKTQISSLPALGEEFRIIGYIVPGLIANDMLRQGVIRTTAATLLVSVIVRLIIMAMM